MNRALLHNVIKTLLEKMSEQNRMLTMHEGSFSQIETDLLRKQCLELYEAIGQLHLQNTNSSHLNLITMMPEANAKSAEPVQEEPEPVSTVDVTKESEGETGVIVEEEQEEEEKAIETILIPEPEAIIEARKEPTPHFVPVKKSLPEDNKITPPLEQIVPEITAKETIIPQFVPVEEKPDPIYVPPAIKVNKEKSVLEKISQEPKSKTIHEHISSTKEEKLLHDAFPNSKIPSIPSAIDISKRFEIQNNLFGGQSQAYSQAIRSLEDAGDKKTALDVFDAMANRLNWDTDSDLVKEFKSLIYRKY